MVGEKATFIQLNPAWQNLKYLETDPAELISALNLRNMSMTTIKTGAIFI
jgi:hypothetical protein